MFRSGEKEMTGTFSPGTFFYSPFGNYFARLEFVNLDALIALKIALGARGSSKIAVSPTLNSSAQLSPRIDRECSKTADFRFRPLSSVRGL